MCQFAGRREAPPLTDLSGAQTLLNTRSISVNPIRVLIADNHPIVRRGIRAWLAEQPDIEVCGEAETGIQALVKTALLKPDVTIIDLDIPEMSGIEVARLTRKVPASAEVLIFTERFAENTAGEILRSGALGYLLKADSHADFLSAIEHMRLRKIYLTRRLTAATAAEPRCGEAPPARTARSGLTLLTSRERQVFALVAKGKRSNEVARRLGITPRQVAAHRKHAMLKLSSYPLNAIYPPAYRKQGASA
jgi:DNA-binding NarL/FixJ family response regulator